MLCVWCTNNVTVATSSQQREALHFLTPSYLFVWPDAADVVPRPVITMSVVQSNVSAGFCRITVNCSVWDDWLLANCDEHSCTSSQESLTKVNISISSDNRTVICSGNNQLSTNNVSKSMTTTCKYCIITFEIKSTEKFSGPLHIRWKMGVSVLIMCFYVFPGFSKSKAEDKEASQPLYIILIVLSPLILCAFLLCMVKNLFSKCHHQVSCIY